MKTKKISLLVLLCIMALSLASCSLGDTINSMRTSKSKEVLTVKNAVLPELSTNVTIGAAVDDFLSSPKWQFFTSDKGEKVVQCDGKASYSGKNVNVTLQFLLGNNDAVSINSLSINDVDQTGLIAEGFYEKIYEDYAKKHNVVLATATPEATAVPTATPAAASGASTAGYIIPDSDKRAISADEIKNLSKQDLEIARNEIYARHGRQFKTQYLQEHFNSCAWYSINPNYNYDNEDSMVSSLELQNILTIKSVESSK